MFLEKNGGCVTVPRRGNEMLMSLLHLRVIDGSCHATCRYPDRDPELGAPGIDVAVELVYDL
ncbi:hypothetical protein [Saccharopolyspora sp. NPDC002376]